MSGATAVQPQHPAHAPAAAPCPANAGSAIVITKPAPGEMIHDANLQATGTAPTALGKIKGKLSWTVSGVVQVKDGATLAEPGDWVIAFDVALKEKVDYCLRVETWNGGAMTDWQQVTFTYEKPSASGHRGLLLKATPDLSGQTVHSTFVNSGPSDYPVAATMCQPGGPVYPGMPLLQAPPNFAVRFINVPPGPNYTIFLVNTNNPPDAYKEPGITVIP
jgi:hypothetical protein